MNVNVDTYRFWLAQTSPVTLRMQKQVYYGCIVLLDSNENKLISREQCASPSAHRNTRVDLVLCLAQKCVSIAISDDGDIPDVSDCDFLREMTPQ